MKKIIAVIIILIVISIDLYYYKSYNRLSMKARKPGLMPEAYYQDRNLTRLWWQSRFSEYHIAQMSSLGKFLFLHQNKTKMVTNKRIYQILMWKYAKMTAPRYLSAYQNAIRNPFDGCSVSNCKILNDDSKLQKADMIVFHLHKMQGSDIENILKLPRKDEQIFVFLTDESPLHTNLFVPKLNGFFNWSMTYQSESDVPVPYGRITKLPKDSIINRNRNYHGEKSNFIAIMGANCGKGDSSRRYVYVDELITHIKIDVWGPCGNRYNMSFHCPGHFRRDCHGINSYRFYLAFENSLCSEYLTEKLWWNAYEKLAVPVVLGGLWGDYQFLVPPNSYINVEDFEGPKELANYLTFLNKNPIEYNKFHEWRNQYKVLNEHGYFGAPIRHYCRLCEAINVNSKGKKTYHNLEEFWNKSRNCRLNDII